MTSATFSVKATVPSGQTLRLFGHDGTNNNILGTLTLQPNGRYAYTGSSNDFKNVINFRIYSQPYTGGSTVITQVSEAMLDVNGTSTDYIPYTADTYSVTWESEAGTVYGGSVDLVSGVLTVDRVIDTITKNSTWYSFKTGTGNSSAVVQLTHYQNCLYIDGASSKNGAISTTGKEAENYWINQRENEVPSSGDMCFAYSSTGQIRFHRTDVSTITDLESFKTNFPDTQVVYKITNPTTYQLTPQEVTTLLGSNNVWADTGDTSVGYVANTKLYIDSRI